MVPGLPVSFFVAEPGFLLRSTLGTAGPGLAVDMICRTFRHHDFILKEFEIELTHID